MIPKLSTKTLTPYNRGVTAAKNGEASRGFPKANASWEERLWHRGWQAGAGEIIEARRAADNAKKQKTD